MGRFSEDKDTCDTKAATKPSQGLPCGSKEIMEIYTKEGIYAFVGKAKAT